MDQLESVQWSWLLWNQHGLRDHLRVNRNQDFVPWLQWINQQEFQ